MHNPIAICTNTKPRAVAACEFQLQQSGGAWQQLFPAGQFSARDGRPHDAAHWFIDAAIAAAVIQRYNARVNDAVIDYEHQTLHTEENGKPAPAAGWIKQLEWRDGEGLFAQVDWTRTAQQLIENGEYRYLSPVFAYADNGDVLSLEMAAITNYPGLDGMQALAAMRNKNPEDKTVELLELLNQLLGLPEKTDQEKAIAALKALKARDAQFAKLCAELGVGENADAATLTTAVAALKAKTDTDPDPAKFVPVTVVEELRKEFAALSNQITTDQVSVLVAEALEDGRLLKAQEKWATDLGTKDIAALKSYLSTSEPLAALRGKQSNNAQQATTDENGLTADELAVCKNMGLAPADFAKSKK